MDNNPVLKNTQVIDTQLVNLEAWAGIEPAIELLQSSALPLGYHAFQFRLVEERQAAQICQHGSSFKQNLELSEISSVLGFDLLGLLMPQRGTKV